ncbi:MAG: hypothetical protein HQL31_11715, partial [Planctomycetes bacterium]|nr:hypothetical protein [Planctomycetota bacterium]
MNRFMNLVSLEKETPLDELVKLFDQTHTLSMKAGLKTALIPYYVRDKRKAEVLAAIRDTVFTYPGDFDWKALLWNVLLAGDLFTEAEQFDLLDELLAKGGASAPLKALADQMGRTPAWSKLDRFIAFKKILKEKPKGSELLMSTHVEVCQLDKKDNGKALISAFLEQYKDRIPGGEEKAQTLAELTVYAIFKTHIQFHWNRKNDLFAAADQWCPRLSDTGSGWDWLLVRLQNHGGADRASALYRVAPYYAKLLDAGQKGTTTSLRYISMTNHPKDDDKSFFSNSYDQLGFEDGLNYVLQQAGIWPANILMEELNKLVQMKGYQGEKLYNICDLITRFSSKDAPVAPQTLNILLDQYLSIDVFKMNPSRPIEVALSGALYRCGDLPGAEKFLRETLAKA